MSNESAPARREYVRRGALQAATAKVCDSKRPLRAIAADRVAKGHTISHEGVAGVLKAAEAV